MQLRAAKDDAYRSLVPVYVTIIPKCSTETCGRNASLAVSTGLMSNAEFLTRNDHRTRDSGKNAGIDNAGHRFQLFLESCWIIDRARFPVNDRIAIVGNEGLAVLLAHRRILKLSKNEGHR